MDLDAAAWQPADYCSADGNPEARPARYVSSDGDPEASVHHEGIVAAIAVTSLGRHTVHSRSNNRSIHCRIPRPPSRHWDIGELK